MAVGKIRRVSHAGPGASAETRKKAIGGNPARSGNSPESGRAAGYACLTHRTIRHPELQLPKIRSVRATALLIESHTDSRTACLRFSLCSFRGLVQMVFLWYWRTSKQTRGRRQRYGPTMHPSVLDIVRGGRDILGVVAVDWQHSSS